MKSMSNDEDTALNVFNRMFLRHRASCAATVKASVIDIDDAADTGTFVVTCPACGATAQASVRGTDND